MVLTHRLLSIVFIISASVLSFKTQAQQMKLRIPSPVQLLSPEGSQETLASAPVDLGINIAEAVDKGHTAEFIKWRKRDYCAMTTLVCLMVLTTGRFSMYIYEQLTD